MVELLVSLGIIIVVLTVILKNQSFYTESAALTGLADDVAARVSEAQAYGVAVKERSIGTSDFTGAYGISLTLLGGAGSNLYYLLFIDRNANGIYDGTSACTTGGANECLEKVTITRGNYLDNICIIKTAGTDTCGTPQRGDVTFLRPSTSAQISVFNSSGTTYSPGNMAGVRFIFKSPSGLSRSVAVYYSGQVSVQTP